MIRGLTRYLPAKRTRQLDWFARDESGAMIIFGLMIFILMLMAGGMAVDLMRYETQRVKLQYTLDRAVLAAAALSETDDPEDVVVDYFAKAGLDSYTLDVAVDQGLTYREVKAVATSEVPSIFMNMIGVDSMTAPSSGSALERIMKVEISIVLDISGSMGGSKIVNMRNAAKDFVTAVLPPSQQHLVNVSIIPYNGKVNAGSLVASYFPFSTEHTASNCVRFSNAQYQTTGIASGTILERLAHFDKNSGGTDPTPGNPHCQTSEYGAILPWSNSVADLHAKITSLNAGGWTAMDLGMKWATILLDPSSQDELTAMSGAGHVDAAFVGRPAAYSDTQTMKIVIIMTDGSNTNQYDMKPEYKSGPSNVFIWNDTGQPGDDGDGEPEYSLWIPEQNAYKWVDDTGWHTTPEGGNDALRLTYPQLWALHPVRYVADTLYANGGHGWKNRIRNAYQLTHWGNPADINLLNTCDAAKAQDVVIFAIGFQAPAAGQAVMQNCASSPSHYYDVSGLQIADAFGAIARTINMLKLTQ